MLPKSQHKESHKSESGIHPMADLLSTIKDPPENLSATFEPRLLDRSYEIGEMTTENPKALDLLPKGLRDSYQNLMDFADKYSPKFVETEEAPF